jgi:hypothetical protein
MFAGKLCERLDGVVADSDNLSAGRFDLFEVGLQLNQLLLAVGSPACRAIKDQGDLALTKELIECAFFSVLVL